MQKLIFFEKTAELLCIFTNMFDKCNFFANIDIFILYKLIFYWEYIENNIGDTYDSN